MTSATTWRTDDPCPVCGTGLTATDNEDGQQVTQDCGLCGWSVSWQASADLDGTGGIQGMRDGPRSHRGCGPGLIQARSDAQ